MRNLIEFIYTNKHWFVFVLLEVLSFTLLFQYNKYQGSAYFTSANAIAGGVYDFTSNASSFFDLRDNNTRLEAVNDSLQAELLALKEATRGKLKPYSREYQTLGAEVINMSLYKSHNLMTINRGEDDGVRTEMGVVCSSGVVGIVYKTTAHYAVVMPLLNVDSRVSCRITDKDYFGTMTWDAGSPLYTIVSGIPRHAEIKKGDRVETNGFSDIFPAGIPLGWVVGIGESMDGLSYELTVRLSVDFASLRDIGIITNYRHTERRQLETHDTD